MTIFLERAYTCRAFPTGPFHIPVLRGGEMAKTTITGNVDKKPVSQATQTKVQDALKSALKSELIGPTHHIEFTHINIVWDEAV
ncbi:hypothetical protein ACFPT7_23030 [Acidicapsa dinghuensis]|uniref:Uncharacterized protein n=1 Tax=Acidicapsa dinghuensis TaxID=2218256 RepID=A0ABW1EMQ9_9BACT|nr:hypothetical protein [Acidicapsa dinghuensis]